MLYRPCVGIVLVNRSGFIFLAQRRGVGKCAWQMPQGGIDGDELPRSAAIRELAEETGVDKAEIVAESLNWLEYDYPPDAKTDRASVYHGQRQKWFLMRFLAEDTDINIGKDNHPEFKAWRWATPEEVLAEIVSFKYPIYRAVLNEFKGNHPDVFVKAEGMRA